MLRNDLPEIYMITNDDFEDAEALVKKVEVHLKNGVKLVQLRIKNQKKNGYDFYAGELLKICNKYSANLVLNHSLKSIPKLDCFGIHITSKELMATDNIPNVIKEKYAVSCPVHNYEELKKANELKLDFAIVTPIQKSISYPSAPIIGWENAELFPKRTDIPLFAAGGMSVDTLQKAKNHGFIGVACLGSLWE